MTEAVVQRIETRAVSQRIPIAILVAAVIAAPWVVYPFFAMKVLCFALFACAFNLLIGYVGLLSFGHALFFGGASYASAHAALAWGWPPELAILFSVVVGAALGLVVGLIAIRRQGIYFSMITLALAQMFYFYCLRERSSPAARTASRASRAATSRTSTSCTTSWRRSSSPALR